MLLLGELEDASCASTLSNSLLFIFGPWPFVTVLGGRPCIVCSSGPLWISSQKGACSWKVAVFEKIDMITQALCLDCSLLEIITMRATNNSLCLQFDINTTFLKRWLEFLQFAREWHSKHGMKSESVKLMGRREKLSKINQGLGPIVSKVEGLTGKKTC